MNHVLWFVLNVIIGGCIGHFGYRYFVRRRGWSFRKGFWAVMGIALLWGAFTCLLQTR